VNEFKHIPTPHSYSLAVATGDLIFLGLHRDSGDGFSTQLDSTFKFLEKTLTEFNLTLANLLKVNVWFKHIENLPEIERYFSNFLKKE